MMAALRCGRDNKINILQIYMYVAQNWKRKILKALIEVDPDVFEELPYKSVIHVLITCNVLIVCNPKRKYLN